MLLLHPIEQCISLIDFGFEIYQCRTRCSVFTQRWRVVSLRLRHWRTHWAHVYLLTSAHHHSCLVCRGSRLFSRSRDHHRSSCHHILCHRICCRNSCHRSRHPCHRCSPHESNRKDPSCNNRHEGRSRLFSTQLTWVICS